MKIPATCFLLLACLAFIAFANSLTVKGKVLLPTGKPAANISVSLEGGSKRTQTTGNGTFSINVSKLPATLTFSGAGFEDFHYKVTEKNKSSSIQITLLAIISTLDEVVVTGHAGDKKGYAPMGSALDKRLFARITGVSRSYEAFTSSDISRERHFSAAPPANKMITPEAEGSSVGATKETRHVALTRMLTAGELSDFKKWKLWGDYSEQDFKLWSKHWGIAPKQRYCVQVQNQEHKPVVGQYVYLVSKKTKDTVWQAVTDNTGKAELWAGIYNDDQEAYNIACRNEIIQSPVEFSNGINRVILKKSCTVSNVVDIAFVVDATGSMGDEIRYLQEELQDVISKTASKYKDVQLFSGAVFYRDRTDDYLTRHINFQHDPSLFIDFVRKQSAGGGGDFPEAVEDALTTAIDSLQWHSDTRAKVLFLVLDAPPHDAAKDRMKVLITQAAVKGIRIVPIVCTGIDKSTEYLMRCIALATNGSYVFLTDDSGIGNAHIKPTTDEFKVELLNTLLQRLIGDMVYVPDCNTRQNTGQVIGKLADTTIVTVYPNPSRGNITIQSSHELKDVFITDFTGKILMKLSPVQKNGRAQVNLANYPSGTYLVKFLVEGKGWETVKVVLIH